VKSRISVKIFADGAEVTNMIEMSKQSYIQGLTTNPTLMKQAGVTNYTEFAKQVLENIKTKPISFEVFSDDLTEMKKQAKIISGWGDNVYVKIPVTNTLGISTAPIVKDLSDQGVKINVTAVTTIKQVLEISNNLNKDAKSFVSVFAGRIADTGVDPIPTITRSLEVLESHTNCEVIWASPRELLNVIQASEIGCHVITVTNDIIKKLSLIDKDLETYSLETVQMFYKDANQSNFTI
jgi:transaldolase